MRYILLLSLLTVAPCWCQTNTGKAETSGPCSPAVTGNNNQFTITCPGISKEQGQKMLNILNKILVNQLDPKQVMAKLDEILKAVNPNLPVKAYFCNGTWRTAGPGANAGLEMNMGGDDSALQEMIRLNNSHQYPDLLKKCLSEIDSKPEWLTPRLFCSIAYASTGNRTKAKEMLLEFDSRTGPAYDAEPCHQLSEFLHKNLQ